MKTKGEIRNSSEDRVAILKQLSLRPFSSLDSSTVNESAYKRRGIELLHIPHSSFRLAKGFDPTI